MAIQQPGQPTNIQVLDLFNHYESNDATTERVAVLQRLFPEINASQGASSETPAIHRKREAEATGTDTQVFGIFMDAHPNKNELIIRYLGLDTWETEGNKEAAVRQIVAVFTNGFTVADPTNLDLSNLGLTSLPASIGKLTELRNLHCPGNQLTSLPESIGNLSHLRTIECSRNGLTSLPDSIGHLQELRGLYLRDNQFDSIPQSLSECHQLNSLDFSFNQLAEEPPAAATQGLNLTLYNLENNPYNAPRHRHPQMSLQLDLFFRDQEDSRRFQYSF